MRSDWATFNMWRENSAQGVMSDLMSEMNNPHLHVIHLQEAKNWVEEIRKVCNAMSEDGVVWEAIIAPSSLPRAARNNITLYRSDVLGFYMKPHWIDLPNPKVDMDRWATLVGFKYLHTKKRRQVFDINTHIHPHIEQRSWWPLPRQDEARDHIRWAALRCGRVRRFRAVVCSADWNVNLRSKLVRIVKAFPTARFARVGMRHNFSLGGWTKLGTKGRRWIDAMFVREKAWFRVVRNRITQKRSDHNFVLTTMEVNLT